MRSRGALCAVSITLLLAVGGCGRVGFAWQASDGNQPSDSGDVIGDGAFGTLDASTARPNRAFVSGTDYSGALGGVTGADAACQAEAASAGLVGSFVAVIRSSSRGTLDPLIGSRGWVDLLGTPIADQPTDWAAHRMMSPLHVDQHGSIIGFTTVLFGSGSGDVCSDWTNGSPGGLGGITTTTDALGDVPVTACNNRGSLFCAEVGFAQPVVIAAAPGRVAFVTSASWIPNGGRASADALCASEAGAVGLPGSYLALLATSMSSGFDRFSPAGPPWRRVDGAQLTISASTFLNAQPINFMTNFLTQGATGAAVAPTEAWNGSSANNCNNWTTNSLGQNAATGSPYSILHAFFWQRSLTVPCSTTGLPIMCLQQ